jgi:hypothetical protein
MELKYVPMVDIAKPRKEADQLSTAYRELDAIILRRDQDMLRQLLGRFIPRRRPFRTQAVRAAETDTHEPPSNTALGEAYQVHAATHGPNRLLPVDALPTRLGVHEEAKPGAEPSIHEQSMPRRVC